MIELGVVALLIANASVSALVPANRITPLVLTVGAPFPAITYEALPSTTTVFLDGTISEQTERIRLKCHGLKYTDAGNVAQAIHDLLDTYEGTLPDGTVTQVIDRTSGMDFFLSDQKVYGKTIEFTFFY